VWLTLPFYDFCGFRSVAVNSVYKLQFFFTFFTLMTASKVSEIDGGSKDSALMNSFAMYYMTVSDKISEIHEFKYIEASVFV